MTEAPKAGSEGCRLRIIVGENQRHDHLPVYEWLTRQAMERQLAGATVYRAEMGYGASSRAKKTGLPSLSSDGSVIVEIVDSRHKLLEFLSEIERNHVVRKGIATLEPVEVLFYRRA